MKWISSYCNNAQYILKTDDDIIVNTFKILRHIQRLGDPSKYFKTVFCINYKTNGVVASRNPKNKWYIKFSEYNHTHFGEYCSGSAFLLTKDMAPLLFNISHYIKSVWVDDYYLTGLM